MTTSQQPPEDRAQGSMGLWQIIDMVTDPSMPRGEAELRTSHLRTVGWPQIEEAARRWHEQREQARQRLAANATDYGADPAGQEDSSAAVQAAVNAAARNQSNIRDGIRGGRFEVHLPPYTQPDRDDRVPAQRFLEQLTRAGLSVRDICHDPLVLDVETQCQMPPPSAFDQVTIPASRWMSYDSLRELIGGAATDIRTTDERSRLLQRVEAARREVAIMNIALDNGADPCSCGSWEVTWSTAFERWICSICADNEAEDLHDEDDARADGLASRMQGISTGLCVYDEICGMPGPVEFTPQTISREHFVAQYWRAGLDIVSPAGHIRITGV